MTSDNEPKAIMATYFDCWRKGDLATLRTILADDFSFRGPLGQVDNAEDGVKALRGLVQMTTDIVVRKVSTDGPGELGRRTERGGDRDPGTGAGVRAGGRRAAQAAGGRHRRGVHLRDGRG